MKKKNSMLKISYLWAAFLLFASCTQDELTDNADALPEGQYPVKIASVSISGESSVQPWGARSPQTRVSENTDGSSSVWTEGDEFYVKFSNSDRDQIGTYQIGEPMEGSYMSEAVKPLYWRSKTKLESLIVWYTEPYTENGGTLDLSDQTDGLAYVMWGETTATYTTEKVSLNFSHQLAKVCVNLDSDGKDDVNTVEIRSYTSCTHDQGTVTTGGATEGWITMMPCNYNGTKCWEANVVPNHEITAFRVNGTEGTLANGSIIPVKGTINTLNVTVTSLIPEDAQEVTGEIKDNGNYKITTNKNSTVTITGGFPTIYLDADITASSGCGISITGGNPTIHVVGEHTVTANKGAGIYVASGSTVTIQGSSRSDMLTVQAGYNGAGIGGSADGKDCGNISIKDVTVIAKASGYDTISPGIGSTGTNSCGTITIDNATVYAYGDEVPPMYATPGIGTGMNIACNIGKTAPTVTIKNASEVHTYRGSVGNADYIGLPSNEDQLSSGEVRATIEGGSKVYCYTGKNATVPDKTVVYDENGNIQD